jgi:hypothetical protein
LLQSLNVPAEGTKDIREAAADLAILRADPHVASRAVGELTKDQPYRIIESHGQWVRLRTDNGRVGWTSISEFCRGACQAVLDSAIFTNNVVAITAGLSEGSVPESLTPEADAFSHQLAALGRLNDSPLEAVDTAGRWLGRTPADSGFANLDAVARVAVALETARKRQPNFDSIRLEPIFVQEVANDLAASSVTDPTDLTILQNLAVLYGYLDDGPRRDLALKIAADIRARKNQ